MVVEAWLEWSASGAVRKKKIDGQRRYGRTCFFGFTMNAMFWWFEIENGNDRWDPVILLKWGMIVLQKYTKDGWIKVAIRWVPSKREVGNQGSLRGDLVIPRNPPRNWILFNLKLKLLPWLVEKGENPISNGTKFSPFFLIFWHIIQFLI